MQISKIGCQAKFNSPQKRSSRPSFCAMSPEEISKTTARAVKRLHEALSGVQPEKRAAILKKLEQLEKGIPNIPLTEEGAIRMHKKITKLATDIMANSIGMMSPLARVKSRMLKKAKQLTPTFYSFFGHIFKGSANISSDVKRLIPNHS